jgi:hypothetical protein
MAPKPVDGCSNQAEGRKDVREFSLNQEWRERGDVPFLRNQRIRLSYSPKTFNPGKEA